MDFPKRVAGAVVARELEFESMFIPHYVSYDMSGAMCHVSPVTCPINYVYLFLFYFFKCPYTNWTKGWSLLVEGLLSTEGLPRLGNW